jgi:hypothetical protein
LVVLPFSVRLCFLCLDGVRPAHLVGSMRTHALNSNIACHPGDAVGLCSPFVITTMISNTAHRHSRAPPPPPGAGINVRACRR